MAIKEDYVSFETAKLLKEKGFNERLFTFYITDEAKKEGCFQLTAFTDDKIDNNHSYHCYLAPTLQMAMKWLREVHNIFICILPSEVGAGVMDYTYVLYKIDAKNFYFEDLSIQGRANNISEISYEQACEAAIKYCLKNLI